MTVAPITYAEAKATFDKQSARLHKATQDFEAVFVGQMLKQMRKSMAGDNALFGKSQEAKMYQEMLDDATAQDLSKTGKFGLSNVLYNSLKRTLPLDPDAVLRAAFSLVPQGSSNKNISENRKQEPQPMLKATQNPAALRRILQQELAVGRRLIALAEQQTEAITGANLDQLAHVNGEQQACLEQQQMLEKARDQAACSLAFGLRFERVPPLKELLTRLPAREQETLNALRQQLLDCQTELDSLNTRNRLLLDNALDYVRFSLELLTSVALQPARYGTNLATVATPTFYIDSKA